MKESPPAREVWIEILHDRRPTHPALSHLPRGRCGITPPPRHLKTVCNCPSHPLPTLFSYIILSACRRICSTSWWGGWQRGTPTLTPRKGQGAPSFHRGHF